MSEHLMSEQASEWAGERGWPTPAHPRGLASALTCRIGIPQDFDAGTHGTRRALQPFEPRIHSGASWFPKQLFGSLRRIEMTQRETEYQS